jgi:hypothetical protein
MRVRQETALEASVSCTHRSAWFFAFLPEIRKVIYMSAANLAGFL